MTQVVSTSAADFPWRPASEREPVQDEQRKAPTVITGIEVREQQDQPTAVIRWRGPVEGISEGIQSGLGRTYEAVQRAGIEPSGPPVVRYLGMGPDEFEAEIGWPVPATFSGDGDIVASSLPAGRVAVVSYFGPYEGVSEAYEAVQQWCAERNLHPAGAPWESYLTDPETEPDTSKWQTDVYQPVSG